MTDHLPVPPDPLYPPLIVPCLSITPYDGLEFHDYPSRRGWDLNMLKAGFFNQYPAEQTAAFLQDWLYFGLIHQILSANKTDYVVQDLACQYGRVTTKNLRRDVSSQLDALNDGLEFGKGPQHIVDRAKNWLHETEAAIMTLRYFCQLASNSVQNGVQDLWPISPEIDLSFRVLGVTLAAMCSSMSIRLSMAILPRGLDFRGSPLAESRMREARWCPSEIERASKEFSAPSMHYISTMRRAETGRNHSHCTSTKCEAYYTDPATYQTQHVLNGCECSDVFPDIASIVKIIGAGRIPLLTIRTDASSNPLFIVETYKPGMEYVALSHVWADGLGNAKNNALPRCQTLRLKAILDELTDSKPISSMLNSFHVKTLVRRQRNISVRFWFDTICIPLQHIDLPARKAAIKTMRHVYQNAYQILILDKELTNASHVTILDTFMRCSLSGWMRRLWTLQEAVLGDRLFVKLKDRVIDVQECYEMLQKSPREQDSQSGAEIPLERFYGSPFSDCLQFYYGMRGMRGWLHAPEERRITHLIRSKPVDSPESLAAAECRGVMAAFRASRYRTTSRKEDVYVCLGNLLGYDADLSKVPLDQRVRTILEQKNTLPHGILFVPGPRTKYAGWRWAVSDFDTEDQSLMTGDLDDTNPARMSSNGLVVSYPGLLLPQALGPDAANDFAMPVCVDSNGNSKAWWRFNLLPIDSSTAGESNAAFLPGQNDGAGGNQKHCILFHAKEQTMRVNVHLAAALISVGTSDVSRISDLGSEVVCRFVRLVVAQYVGGDHDLAILRQRRDVNVQIHNEGFAWPIFRNWTIG